MTETSCRFCGRKEGRYRLLCSMCEQFTHNLREWWDDDTTDSDALPIAEGCRWVSRDRPYNESIPKLEEE